MTDSATLKPLSLPILLEAIPTHGVLLWLVGSARLNYLLLQSALLIEMLVITALSLAMYPQLVSRRRVEEIPWMAFFFGAILFFGAMTYGFARILGGAETMFGTMQASLEGGQLRWVIGVPLLLIGIDYLVARRSSKPHVAWARSVLMPAAVAQVTMIVMVFVPLAVILVAGVADAVLSTMSARPVGLRFDADLVLGSFWVALRCVFTVRLLRMPEAEVERIASQPYADD